MIRRRALIATGIGLLGFLVGGACAGGASSSTAPAPTVQPGDLKQVATNLQTKTVAMIEAIASKNDGTISRVRTELQREADGAEDAIKSQTGSTANRVNAAVQQIRAGVLNNDVARLEQARSLLQQAAQ
ncbi:MAG: hypothetical protein M3442_02140 [Chloroflexota bacterium]|nr:hypothetical protein [Chloroflexota bacterium]